MSQWINHLAVLTGLIVCAGCHRTPAAPEPGGSPPNSPVYSTPPVRGLVREVNGGPIAGAGVTLFSCVGPCLRTTRVVSDEAGVFVVPPATDLCKAARTVGVEVGKAGYWFRDGQASIACTAVSNPAEVTLEVKGQRDVTAVRGVPVEILLSNDDLNWLTDETGYSCGPCSVIHLEVPPQGPAAIRVEWSGPDPIGLWLEGFRGYDGERLR